MLSVILLVALFSPEALPPMKGESAVRIRRGREVQGGYVQTGPDGREILKQWRSLEPGTRGEAEASVELAMKSWRRIVAESSASSRNVGFRRP